MVRNLNKLRPDRSSWQSFYCSADILNQFEKKCFFFYIFNIMFFSVSVFSTSTQERTIGLLKEISRQILVTLFSSSGYQRS